MVPLAKHLEKDLYKIYFTSRDQLGRGRIFYIVVNLMDMVIENKSPTLALDIGSVGMFDDMGVTAGCIIDVKGEECFYYSGINVRNTIPFSSNTGIAQKNSDGSWKRKYDGPVLDLNHLEPHFSTMPYILHYNNLFHVWYLSGVRWEKDLLSKSGVKHYYNIKYASSNDGINWDQTGQVAIDFKDHYEYAISRPCVIKDGLNDFKMWYSYRAQKEIDTYRIGYAESKNGINWVRKDDYAGIDVSNSGWDSGMICYPHVFDHKEKRYMLYNGNDYGKTGFGLAVLEHSH